MPTSALRSPPRCRSTSATREVPGSAAATKTPTAWSASTSREEPTSRASPKRISMRLPCDSINVRERPWASKLQPINYKRCCTDRLNSHPGSGPVPTEGRGRSRGHPQPSPGMPERVSVLHRSGEAVEAHRASRHDLMSGLGRQAFEALQHHFRCARKEAVGVRIIRRPQNLVRPDVVGQHFDAVLDRLERNPAIALKKLAWPRFQPAVVEPLIVEMPVHPV